MARELRIVFMGTPDFAVTTLDALIVNNYTVVGVVTTPDKPAGRGRKLHESAVKIYAKKKGLPILQPTRLKNEKFIEALTALEPNVQVVVAFRMLPKIVWNIPAYGTFNLHASLLPNYRGAAPINWAIINGETKTGVTTFFIDDKIDTGEIILQEAIEIEPKETAGMLHDKLMSLGSQLVVKTIDLIASDKIETKKQSEQLALKPAPKLNKDNCRINWNDSLEHINNQIRGLSPYPVAWSQLSHGDEILSVKIFQAEIQKENHNLTPGKLIVSKHDVLVAVSDGYLDIKEIQFPGKRKMDIKSLLNGFVFFPNDKML